MTFKYIWKHKEANFGKPMKHQVKWGTHITLEIILKWNQKYIALRRQSIPGHEQPLQAKKYPKGLLYFCHNLIRYGESVEKCVKRMVKFQTGIGIKSFKLVDLESSIQKKDDQWAITLYVIANLSKKPKVGNFGNQITEVVEFDTKNIPNDFAWWSKKDLADFLKANQAIS